MNPNPKNLDADSLNAEINRLLDIMPASGRMLTRLISKPHQFRAIVAKQPLPWQKTYSITINFDLWWRLSQPERDLLLLHSVCWLVNTQWIKPGLYQGLTALGILATGFELLQANATGTIVAGGLTAFATTKIRRKNSSDEAIIAADNAALRVAQRRGYTEADAARHLINGIADVAKLEGRPNLTLTEGLRTQNLRSIAGLSPLNQLPLNQPPLNPSPLNQPENESDKMRQE